MKDAFGGAFMIKIILIFLSIYIAFMAVALNYAKAFRVKNQIINIIEQYEGFYESGNGKTTDVKEVIKNYAQRMSYDVPIPERMPTPDNNKECTDLGYCITTINSGNGTYYVVETYVYLQMPFSLPLINLQVTVPIRGETKVIKNLLD